MRARIAVTGASGFLGRHVVDALRGPGGVDVVACGRRAERMAALPAEVDRVEHDLASPAAAFALFGKPDVVLHLAWQGLPNYRSPRHLETELPVQYAFLRQLIADGAKSLVVVGTCFEYGAATGCLSEDAETDPITTYGSAKDTLRRQLEALQRVEDFSLTWIRLFYVYGEGQPATSLWPMVRAALKDRLPVFNMSGGEQLRDFLPVGVAARKIARLALAGENAGIVNVCSGVPRSVRSLVEDWISAAGGSMKLNLGFYPYADYEPMEFWGSTRKLNALVAHD